jgi:hypothetical protein
MGCSEFRRFFAGGQVFAGLSEVLGAVLLVPAHNDVAALIIAGVMANVVMMNRADALGRLAPCTNCSSPSSTRAWTCAASSMVSERAAPRAEAEPGGWNRTSDPRSSKCHILFRVRLHLSEGISRTQRRMS